MLWDTGKYFPFKNYVYLNTIKMINKHMCILKYLKKILMIFKVIVNCARLIVNELEHLIIFINYYLIYCQNLLLNLCKKLHKCHYIHH